jgi:hypothetical protein
MSNHSLVSLYLDQYFHIFFETAKSFKPFFIYLPKKINLMKNTENINHKKVWITPELIMETVEGTEGKVSMSYETTTITIGIQTFGPS